MKGIKKFFFVISVLLMSIKLFSIDIPNEKIYTNPEREIKTVDAKKNREHAELNITVNKLTPKKIHGVDNDGILEINFPEDEGILKEGERLIFSNDLNDINPRLRKIAKVYSLKDRNLKTVKNDLNETFYVGKVSDNGRDLVSVYEVLILSRAKAIAKINISKMRPGFGYSFDLRNASSGSRVTSIMDHNFKGEPLVPPDSRQLIIDGEDILPGILLDSVKSIETTLTPTSNDEILEKIEFKDGKLIIEKSMKFNADSKIYTIIFKDNSDNPIQELELDVVNDIPGDDRGEAKFNVDMRLLANGWTNRNGRYVENYLVNDWLGNTNSEVNNNIAESVGVLPDLGSEDIEYIYMLSNGILSRALSSNVNISGNSSNHTLKYLSGETSLFYFLKTKANQIYDYLAFVKEKHTAPIKYDVVALTSSLKEIKMSINISSLKDAGVSARAAIDISSFKKGFVLKVDKILFPSIELIDLKGGLLKNNNNIIATHIKYRINNTSDIIVPLVLDKAFLLDPLYNLTINIDGELELEKKAVTETYKDEIMISGLVDIDGKGNYKELTSFLLEIESNARDTVLVDTSAEIDSFKMSKKFNYEFDLSGTNNKNKAIISSNDHNFKGEPLVPSKYRTLKIGNEDLLTDEFQNVSSIEVRGDFNWFTTGKIATTDNPRSSLERIELKGEKLILTRTMFEATNEINIYEVLFKSATNEVIQRLFLEVKNKKVDLKNIIDYQVDDRLLPDGFVTLDGKYVLTENENIFQSSLKDPHLIEYKTVENVTSLIGNNIVYASGIDNRSEESDIILSPKKIFKITDLLSGKKMIIQEGSKNSIYNNIALNKSKYFSGSQSAVLMSETLDRIIIDLNYNKGNKEVSAGSGEIDITNLNIESRVIKSGEPLLTNANGSFLDIKGGLNSNSNIVIGNWIEYQINNGPKQSKKLDLNQSFVVENGKYEIFINYNGEIEVKKIGIEKTYTDIIEIKGGRKLSDRLDNEFLELGTYKLTIKNNRRDAFLPAAEATIDVSKMRPGSIYEFIITPGSTKDVISLSNPTFIGEPTPIDSQKIMKVNKEILNTTYANQVNQVTIPSIFNNEVIKKLEYEEKGGNQKIIRIEKSFLFKAPEKDYSIIFLDGSGRVIQSLTLKIINPIISAPITRSIQIDQRLLSTGWVDKAGRYVFGNDGNWNDDKITDINIATGQSTGGTATNIQYIYRLNNGIIERANSTDVEARGIVKYPTGNTPLYYSKTSGDFFNNFAVRKVTTGAALVEYKVVLVSTTGEEIEATVNLTGTAKGMTTGSGTLDTTTLLNDELTKIKGGNSLLSNTTGSFVDAKGGLTTNADVVIATHVSYKVGAGAYTTVPLTLGNAFMTSAGNYELSINTDGEIEVKKLDISKAYNDVIEI
ncbi:MAG: hypothetical protein ACRC3I_03245, partial [Cetobacterium sp.]